MREGNQSCKPTGFSRGYLTAELFKNYSEDELRDVINWLDDQPQDVKAKVKPILERELNKRAAQAYESMNNGEWI